MERAVFRDQVVIVTGASAGIGRELALELARQGAKVVIAAAARRAAGASSGGVPGIGRRGAGRTNRCF